MTFHAPENAVGAPSVRKKQRDVESIRGFTLLELLIVIGIIGLLLVLLAPAFTTIKGGTDVTSAAYTIKTALETARTYAKANNTYTWIGFKEVDVSRDPSAPQVNGQGRVAFAIVASKDGTRGYDVTNPGAWATNYNNGANLVAIGKLQRLENAHLAGALANTGNMTRPGVPSNYNIGSIPLPPSPLACVTPFDWPLGSALNGGQYSFQTVINFDPQGVARIQYSNNADTISPYTEIDLQQTHGTTVDTNNPNVVAIQVSGVGSSVTVYRP
jgi:prepilin-type N-terminal cleavage/methylation domain-containing protein